MTTCQARPLLIGTISDNPPFSSYASQQNQFYGFEIDLMLEICNRQKIKCQFIPTIASRMVNDLTSGKIDLVLASIIIPTTIVDEPVIFSKPYLISYAQFITNKQSPINQLNEIRNKKVGVRLGTLFHGTMFKNFILEMYNNQVKPVLYLSMSDLLSALQNQEVDAVCSNAVPIRYWYTNNSGLFKLVGGKIPIGNGYAVMAKIGEENLIAQINQSLLQIEQDGTYVAIYSRYFGITS